MSRINKYYIYKMVAISKNFLHKVPKYHAKTKKKFK
jgi:hypothetical protein